MNENIETPYQRGCNEARKDFEKHNKFHVFQKLSLKERLTIGKNKDTQFYILGYFEEWDYLYSLLPKLPELKLFDSPFPMEVLEKRMREIEEVKRKISREDYGLDL